MKLLLVCTSGGHFATMMRLKPFWSRHTRSWITDLQPDTDQIRGSEEVVWLPRQNPRESLAAVVNFFRALVLLSRNRPDLLLSTGAAIAVPFIYAARLLRIRTAFVESISRVHDLSLSGRLVYAVVNDLYVQWPECAARHSKAQYRGVVA